MSSLSDSFVKVRAWHFLMDMAQCTDLSFLGLARITFLLLDVLILFAGKNLCTDSSRICRNCSRACRGKEALLSAWKIMQIKREASKDLITLTDEPFETRHLHFPNSSLRRQHAPAFGEYFLSLLLLCVRASLAKRHSFFLSFFLETRICLLLD